MKKEIDKMKISLAADQEMDKQLEKRLGRERALDRLPDMVAEANVALAEAIATFGESDYNQKDAEGFINLFGLSIKERAKLSKNWPEVKE